MIPYSRQEILKKDIDAVVKVMKSNWLTQGPTVEKFENTVKHYTKAKYATAVNSATSALHLACLALKVGPGDLVWTSSNSFVASANCALYCGAEVDFVDIDPNTLNISIELLIRKLEKAKKKKKLPKVLIPVHFAGQPCDMERIFILSKKYKFKIIEDASHAIGAYYKLENSKKKNNIKIGSCRHSDITVFSFHPVKIITTAEGGMALTNNRKLDESIKLLRTHGITKSRKFMKKKTKDPWYFEQIELGLNYRMNDIQSAIGIEQCKRIDNFVKSRNEKAKLYDKYLNFRKLNKQIQPKNVYSSYHLYVIRLNLNLLKNTKKTIFNYLRKKGIVVNVHYIPIHTHPFFSTLGFKKGDYPNTESYYESAISLPIYPSLKKKDQYRVIKLINKLV